MSLIIKLMIRAFKIIASGAGSNVTDDYAEFRYYIFANDFPHATSSSSLFM
jgi:hypothetical protein